MADPSPDSDRGRLLVDAWKRAGPELEKQREADIRAADTQRASRVFAGAATSCNRDARPRLSSGLVELQRLLAKGGSRGRDRG